MGNKYLFSNSMDDEYPEKSAKDLEIEEKFMNAKIFEL